MAEATNFPNIWQVQFGGTLSAELRYIISNKAETDTMKMFAFAALVLTIGSTAAVAQTTVIHREGPLHDRTVIKERPMRPVVVHRDRVVHTGSIGCRTVTVTRKNDMGDTVTRKIRRCD